MAQDENQNNKDNDEVKTKEKAFPGFVQLIVLLSLLPVVYDGSIFFVFGALGIDVEILLLENAYDTIHFNVLSLNRRQVVNFNEYSYIAAISLYPFAVLACLIKKRWGWLIFGLSALHFAVMFLFFGSGKEGDVVDFVKEIVHPASFIALAWFTLFGRLISKSFVFFILLCLITPLMLEQGDFPKFVLFPSIAIILLALVGKLVSYAIYQNLYLFKSVGFFRTVWLVFKSVYFWIPLLLIIVPLQYFNWWWHSTIEDQLYEYKYYEENYKQKLPLVGQASWQGRYLENDLRWSIRNYLSMKQQSLNKRLSNFEHKLRDLDAKEYADEAIEKVGKEFNKAFPESLNMKGKKFDGLLSGAKEWASEESAKMTQEAYTKVRDNAREKLMTKLTSVSNEKIVPFVKNKSAYVASFVPKVKETTDQVFTEVNIDAQYSGQWTLRYLRMSHFIFNLLFLFVCVKSFLYVFSRVAFDTETKLFVTLREASAKIKIPPPKSDIKVFGKEYTLSDDGSSRYYFSRQFEPLGCPPKFSIPQAAAAPIARILHGTMALNKVDIKQDEGQVYFSALNLESSVDRP